MLFGAIVVITWAVSRGVPLKPAASERSSLIKLGLLFTAQIGLMNAGASMTSPAFGEVIINSYAIFANLVAHFTGEHERLTAVRTVGLALAFCGLCLVAFGRPVGFAIAVTVIPVDVVSLVILSQLFEQLG